MEIPLWYFLVPYAAFAGLAVLFLLFNIFHIAKFGLQSTKTAFVLSLYLLAFFAVAIISVAIIGPYAWSDTVTLTDIFQTSFTSVPGL